MACGWKLQEFHSYIRLHDLRICEDLRILFLFIPLGSYRKPETPTPEESVTARKQCELSTDVTSSCYSKSMHSVDVGQVWGTLSVGNLLLLWGTMNRRSVEAFASFHAPGLFTGTQARDRSAPVARALLFFFFDLPIKNVQNVQGPWWSPDWPEAREWLQLYLPTHYLRFPADRRSICPILDSRLYSGHVTPEAHVASTEQRLF